MEENEVVVNYEELLTQMYGEMQAQTEILAETKQEYAGLNESIGGLEVAFMAMLVFGILDFCWSCMRQWRKNVLKMGE